MIDKKFYSPKELEKILDASSSTIARRLRDGQIPFVKLGQAFSVRPDYGTAGLVCHFHDGAVVRVEVTRSTLWKMPEGKNSLRK